jgi:predicted FMN-binding regulatory protein PaiB
MNDLNKKHDFIEQFGFALLVSEDLQVTHLPTTLVTEEGASMYYISPNWYATCPAV